MSRENFERIIEKTREVLYDNSKQYSETQKKIAGKIAERILNTPVLELAKAQDPDAYFEQVTRQVLSEDRKSLEPLFVTQASTVLDVVVRKEHAIRLATDYSLDVASVYRVAIEVQQGKLFPILTKLFPILSNKLIIGSYPLLLVQISLNKLTLAEAMVVASAFDLHIDELQEALGQVTARIEDLKVAQAELKNVDEAMKKLKNAKLSVERLYQDLIQMWSVLAARYESLFYESLLHRSKQISEIGPKKEDLKFGRNWVGLEYQKNGVASKLIACLIEGSIVLVQDSSSGRTRLQIFQPKPSNYEPVAHWEVPSDLSNELSNISVSTESKDAEKIVHIKLDNTEGKTQSVSIVCPADDAPASSIDATAQWTLQETALGQAVESILTRYHNGELVTWTILDQVFQLAQKEAADILVELNLNNLHLRLYGVPREFMEVLKEKLIEVYGQEIVSVLDPVICSSVKVVENLMPGGSLHEIFNCTAALHLPVRSEILQRLMKAFQDGISKEIAQGIRSRANRQTEVSEIFGSALQAALSIWIDEYEKVVIESERHLSAEKVNPAVIESLRTILLAEVGRASEYEMALMSLTRHVLRNKSPQRDILIREMSRFGLDITYRYRSMFLGGWFGRGVNELYRSLQSQIEDKRNKIKPPEEKVRPTTN